MSKLLIAYTTRHGTVKKCAKHLIKLISKKNPDVWTADIIDLRTDEVTDIESYDKIVLGCSVYAGRTQKQMTDFIAANKEFLQGSDLGLYLCSLTKKGDEPIMSELLKSSYGDLLDSAKAVGLFGGELSDKKMNFMERIITNIVIKSAEKKDKNPPEKRDGVRCGIDFHAMCEFCREMGLLS